jgi:hypothetical protein
MFVPVFHARERCAGCERCRVSAHAGIAEENLEKSIIRNWKEMNAPEPYMTALLRVIHYAILDARATAALANGKDAKTQDEAHLASGCLAFMKTA